MVPSLIVMLTYNDTTVENAYELYKKCADLPVHCWGFKDVGLPKNEMVRLVDAMRSDGKETYLEVVSLSEEEGLVGAKVAVDCGFDFLTGTVYHESIHDYLQKNNKAYFPFCGSVEGHPSILQGTVDEIVSDAKRLESWGVQGLDLLAYRHEDAPEEIMRRVVDELDIPVVVAGSIGSRERIDLMKQLSPYGFTIGTALFDGRFVEGGTFREQLVAVVEWLNNGK